MKHEPIKTNLPPADNAKQEAEDEEQKAQTTIISKEAGETKDLMTAAAQDAEEERAEVDGKRDFMYIARYYNRNFDLQF